MIRKFEALVRAILFSFAILISACGYTGGMGSNVPQQRARPQYQQPLYLRPSLTPRMPEDDICRSRLYLGLVGQHEGAISFEMMQGRIRVIKPAQTELDRDEFLQDMQPEPPYLEVREYLAGQILYAPAIRAVSIGDGLGPIEPSRITIELSNEGYVTKLSCR